MLKNQKTRRHLTEFWMMDAEYSYLTHDESLDLQEAYVKALLQGVLDRAPQALETLERDTELLKTLHCRALQTHHLRSSH